MVDERAAALAKTRTLMRELEERQAQTAKLIEEIDAQLQAATAVTPADRRRKPRAT